MSVQARQFAGTQRLSPSSSTTEQVQPQQNGVPDDFDCDILIQNTGTTAVWVQDEGSSNEAGFILPNQYNSVELNGHTHADGDVNIYFPDSGGGQVDVSFFK